MFAHRICMITLLPGMFYVTNLLVPTKTVSAYSLQSPPPCASRRQFVAKAGCGLGLFLGVCSFRPTATGAATSEEDIQILKDGSDVLASLVENWDRATVDCTYADVPRELLQQKNKEELLEKASTFALFDKSTSVVSCKTSNRIVRDYLGATGKGPLVGMEKRVLKLADNIDSDMLDDYFAETERFTQSISRATALSWFAGHADFDAINNFAMGEQVKRQDSNLEQSKMAIVQAKESLDNIIGMFSCHD